VKEGGAEVVKIEGGEKRADLIRRIIDAEIPVAGHIGLTPQSVNVMGGYKVQGKNLGGIEQLMRDAVALDRAGVACLFLEGIPREVAAMITAEVARRRLGLGPGPECDGQVLVFHDIVNLTFGPPAKFVRRYGDAAALITNAVQAFRADVKSLQYPSDEESYHLPKETKAGLDTVLARKRAMAAVREHLPRRHGERQFFYGVGQSLGSGASFDFSDGARLARRFYDCCQRFSFHSSVWLRDVFSAVDHCSCPQQAGYRDCAAELLGWTMIGWVVALVWAVKTTFLGGAVSS
jgi:hypothetical protein